MIKRLLPILILIPTLCFAVRIASVGNSITYGYGLSDAWTQSYPSQLDTLLSSNDTVNNFGVSSTTLLKKGNNPYWPQSAFANARAFLPNVVIIELGTNDTKPYNWYVYPTEFPIDYKSLIDTFQILSSAPKVWICLAPFSNNASWQILDTSITLRINPAILQVGLDKGVSVIDLHSTMTNMAWFQSDSVHPNATGAKALAGIVKGYLDRDTLTIQQNGTILTASQGYAYQWYLNGSPINNATQKTMTINQLGTYKVSVKVESTTDSRIVSKPLVVTSLNPVTIRPQATATLPVQNLHVYDLKGRTQ